MVTIGHIKSAFYRLNKVELGKQLLNMSFGNKIGGKYLKQDMTLFDLELGSMIVESDRPIII